MLWKLAGWNVNGLRAITKRGELMPFVNAHKPDVLCLQEIKIDDARRAQFSAKGGPASGWDFPKYTEYFNSAKQPGYSGTAVLVGEALTSRLNLEVTSGLNMKGSEEFDSEGRVQTIEFDKFFLVNAYFPNSREDLSRIDFKSDFNDCMLKHLKKLDKKKPVILTGDYNVAHEPIDLARPKENEGKHGYHPREIEWMNKLLNAGFVDTFRHIHPTKVQYSWWSIRFGKSIRERNIGWRIDYFVVSKRLASKIKSASILDQVMGSDHAPVVLEIDL